MTAAEHRSAILNDRAAAGLVRDDRPDLHDGRPRTWEGPSECVEDMIGSDWSWPSFSAGALVGFVVALVLIGVPAIVLAAVLQ